MNLVIWPWDVRSDIRRPVRLHLVTLRELNLTMHFKPVESGLAFKNHLRAYINIWRGPVWLSDSGVECLHMVVTQETVRHTRLTSTLTPRATMAATNPNTSLELICTSFQALSLHTHLLEDPRKNTIFAQNFSSIKCQWCRTVLKENSLSEFVRLESRWGERTVLRDFLFYG